MTERLRDLLMCLAMVSGSASELQDAKGQVVLTILRSVTGIRRNVYRGLKILSWDR